MKKTQKITALLMAAAVFAAVPLSACGPEETQPYVEQNLAVVVDYNDGSASRPRTYYLAEGASISSLPTPEREGFEIEGWYTEKENGTQITFPFTPTEATTIYAHWKVEEFDVTFNFNFEGSTPLITQVAYNETVSAPAEEEIPENDGYYFFRWETEAGLPVSFPYTVKRDTEFFAHWMENDIQIFTVTFNGNYEGAADPTSLDVVEGEAIESASAPALDRSGYTFKGWATTSDATEPDITFPYTPSESVTLYAVWGREEVRVRFQNNYTGADSVFEDVYVESGTAVTAPETSPEREGFTFKGWYTAAVEGELAQFPVTVERATYFYAQWEADAVTPQDNKFDAEFVHISPNFSTTTYSGNAQGTQIIQEDGGNMNAFSAEYPLLDRNHRNHSSYYVAYLYTNGAELVFNIYSSEAVSGVTLYGSFAYEIVHAMNLAPTGNFGFQIELNGVGINYSITLSGEDLNGGMGNYQAAFKEYQIASGLSLNAGLNTVTLRVNNSNHAGGAMTAIAPQIDYIRLDATGTTLTWHPEYDNLYRRT